MALNIREKIEALASSFSASIQRALSRAFTNIRDDVKIQQIADALERGGITAAEAALRDMGPELRTAILPELQSAINDSGRMVAAAINAGGLTSVPMAFSIIHPQTIAALEEFDLRFITSITESSRTAILNSLRAGIIAGKNPKEVAREIRDTIGLNAQQEQAVRNFRASLESGNAQALEYALRDKRFDRTIERLLRGERIPADKIDTMVERYRQRLIDFRAETIARTEALRAVNTGEFEAMNQAHRDGLFEDEVVRFWKFTKDERTRAAHRQIPGMNPDGVPIDGVYKTPLGPLRFPLDPRGTAANTVRCRCTQQYRIRQEVDVAFREHGNKAPSLLGSLYTFTTGNPKQR